MPNVSIREIIIVGFRIQKDDYWGSDDMLLSMCLLQWKSVAKAEFLML